MSAPLEMALPRLGLDQDHALSARQVASLFGRTTRTLANWAAKGILIPKVINRRRYYLESEVRALWLNKQNIVDSERPIDTS